MRAEARQLKSEPIPTGFSGPQRLVRYRSLAGLIADYERNLSRGRLFVNTRRLVPVGSHLRIVLLLEKPAIRLEAEGIVTRVVPFGNGLNDMPGIQLRLLRLEPAGAQRLDEASRQASRSRRAFHSSSRATRLSR